MDQKIGIGTLYDEFFRGYGAEIRLSCPSFRPNSTYNPPSTTSRFRRVSRETPPLAGRPTHGRRRLRRPRLRGGAGIGTVPVLFPVSRVVLRRCPSDGEHSSGRHLSPRHPETA